MARPILQAKFMSPTEDQVQGAVSHAGGERVAVVGSHRDCWACSPTRPDGLQLAFEICEDGSVVTRFDCRETYAGYNGVLHGGMVATLLDAAMTNCLFARHEVAMTADLRVRFRSAVQVGTPAVIRAWSVRTRGTMEELRAELWQEGELRALARGKFIRAEARGDHET
jgi:acyl-coenzyme A thioesterase PaaI-like protein